MNNNNQQQQRTKRYRYVILSLPVLTVVISVVSTVAAFLVSTYKAEGKGIHFLPFISNIGDHRPESSVFTFGMTLSGCVTYSIIFIRYLQVRNFFVNRDLCNHASLVIGSLFIIGKFMVVSFQLSSQIVVHFFGASVYFIGAFLYCVLQTVISYNDSKYLYRLRLFLSIFMFISGFFFWTVPLTVAWEVLLTLQNLWNFRMVFRGIKNGIYVNIRGRFSKRYSHL